MKGYKATDLKMQCRGMQYAVGGVYHVDGEIEPCENGLHFCEHVKDVFNYYGCDNSRVFEVEASGVIKNNGDKFVTSDLKIIGELSKVEINRSVYGYGKGNGHGYGDGDDDDNDGFGFGCGHNYGNGNGYGDGYSHGYSFGYSYKDGNGFGYSYGYDIQKILVFV